MQLVRLALLAAAFLPVAGSDEEDPARGEAGEESAGPCGAAIPEPAPGRIGSAEEERPASRRLGEGGESGPGWVGFLLGTGGVLALMGGTFALLRRFLRGSRYLAGGGILNVLARKPLGPRQEVFLVEVGPRLILVGSTRDRLSPLGEFSDPGEVTALKARLEGRRPGSITGEFQTLLQEGVRGGEDSDGAEEVRRAYTAIAREVAEIRSRVRSWQL